MGEKFRRLPDAELEIMLVVWQADGPVNSTYIRERLRGRREWALATLMTVLSRLVDKGYLVCEKQGRNNLYHSIIAEEDYKARESKSFLEKLYNNSFENMVTSLYSNEVIGNDEITELRSFLDELEKSAK